MGTIGLGEGLAIASLAVQFIEVGQKCAKLVHDFSSFGENAYKLSLYANHEIRKINPLRNVLLESDKFGLEKSFFDMLEPPSQQGIRSILLEIIRSLQAFKDFAGSYHLETDQVEVDSAEPLAAADLDAHNQEADLFLALRGERLMQKTTTWVKKARWSPKGKSVGFKLVEELRAWLVLLQE